MSCLMMNTWIIVTCWKLAEAKEDSSLWEQKFDFSYQASKIMKTFKKHTYKILLDPSFYLEFVLCQKEVCTFALPTFYTG